MQRPALGATLDRHASEPVVRRERRSSTFCDIWDIVAPGEPCPTCDSRFEDRLREARNG